jgi:hypothetical protein
MINLKKNIEEMRRELYFLLDSKELTDSSVVICSQKLDKLLVKYEITKSLLNREIKTFH